MRHLAKLVAVPFPEVPVPTYNQAQLVEVPTDEQIIAWVDGAQEPARWYWGMMATYGLRPHEVEGAVLIERDLCQVADGTKTGFRTVVPLPREWAKRWQLRERRLRPRLAEVDRPDAAGKWLSVQVKRQGIPWRTYALRHAYAARLWREGGARLDLYTASRLMGHTAQQHAKTYRAHIEPHQVAEAAERALGGP